MFWKRTYWTFIWYKFQINRIENKGLMASLISMFSHRNYYVEIFFNEKPNAYGYNERALNADSKYITYTYVEFIVRPLGAVKLPSFTIYSRFWSHLWKSSAFKPRVQPRYIIYFLNQHWVFFQYIIKHFDSHWKFFQHGDFYGKILKLNLPPILYF